MCAFKSVWFHSFDTPLTSVIGAICGRSSSRLSPGIPGFVLALYLVRVIHRGISLWQ